MTRKLESCSESSLAIDSLVHDSSSVENRIREAIPDYYLLQFAAIHGDGTAQKILREMGNSYAPGTKAALFGKAEDVDWMQQEWDPKVNREKPGLTFKMERKYWRDGLYLYKTSTTFENADFEDFKTFVLSCVERLKWDWTLAQLYELSCGEKGTVECPSNSESCFLFSENKMPCPFSNREYVIARRVWDQSKDGTCFITKSWTHPKAPERKGRNVRIDQYATGCIIKCVESLQGYDDPAVEMSTLYFDNVKINPMAYNLAMSTSMWTAMTATDAGFRKYQLRVHPELIVDAEEVEIVDSVTQYQTKNKSKRRLWFVVLISGIALVALKHKKFQVPKLGEADLCSNSEINLALSKGEASASMIATKSKPFPIM